MTKGNLDELDIAWAELAASAHSKLRTVVYQLDIIWKSFVGFMAENWAVISDALPRP
jgi:hypothetical protein